MRQRDSSIKRGHSGDAIGWADGIAADCILANINFRHEAGVGQAAGSTPFRIRGSGSPFRSLLRRKAGRRGGEVSLFMIFRDSNNKGGESDRLIWVPLFMTGGRDSQKRQRGSQEARRRFIVSTQLKP
jgi:hypothetical protein